MKFTDFRRRTVSLLVLVAFVGLLHFWAEPAPAASRADNSEMSKMKTDGSDQGLFEQESNSAQTVKKEKKFPWLIAALGAAVVGVAVYFLLIKKTKYTLTVSKATGVSGTPAATAKYSKGTKVNYRYTTSAGNMALVKLDGVDAPVSGTVTMDRDHSLAVTAEPSYTLTVSLGANASGTPAATTPYKRGVAVAYSYTAASGYGLEVKLDGAVVPASGTIIMDKDKTLVITAEPLDIRGTWQLSFVYLTSGYNIYDYTSTWIFSGSRENGVFTETAGPVTNSGTYSVSNVDTVWFKYDTMSDTFTGKLTGKQMSGTFAAGSIYNGTWSGSKTSNATGTRFVPTPVTVPAAAQRPRRG